MRRPLAKELLKKITEMRSGDRLVIPRLRQAARFKFPRRTTLAEYGVGAGLGTLAGTLQLSRTPSLAYAFQSWYQEYESNVTDFYPVSHCEQCLHHLRGK